MIPKEKLQALVEAQKQAELDAAEHQIDEAIREGVKQHETTFSVRMDGFHPAIIEEIAAKYRQEKWTVEISKLGARPPFTLLVSLS